MKASYLLALPLLFLVPISCGTSTSGGDAGGSDGSTDSSTPNDGGPVDASKDGATDASSTDGGSKDGGLGAGDPCDPNDDQCGSGLKCCGGGAQLPDANNDHCVTPTDAGTCPLVP